MVQRRSKATGRKTPILTPPAEVLTLRELQDSLHRSIEATSTVDPLAVALSLADFGRAVEDNDIVSANRPVFTIATALFAALRAIRQPYPYFSSPASQLLGQPVAAEILAARADGVLSDEYVTIHRAEVAEDPERRLERLRPLVVSMLAESAIFQGELISRLGSALVLTGLAGFRGLAAAPDHTNSLFQRNIGLTAHDYVLVLLALYAHSLADPFIRRIGKGEVRLVV